jgi:diadenosine tetraphosphate (Ap4A) HIT family hydrolase
MKADPYFDQFLIKKYTHWTVYVHEEQSVLGKVYLWANREDATDLINTSEEEREELFEIIEKLKTALDEMFQPDLYNYLALSNETNHLHIHLEPRYQEIRVFETVTFKDELYGKRHTLTGKKHPEEILMTIKHTLQNKLN